MLQGGQAVLWEDLIADPALDRLDAEAWRLARTWYRHPAAAGACRYDGYDIGELSELYFGNYFAWLLKTIEAVRAVALRHESRTLLVADKTRGRKVKGLMPDEGESALVEACRSSGVIFESFVPVRSSDLASRQAQSVKARLRSLLSPLEGVGVSLSSGRKPFFLVASAPHHVRPLLPELKRRYRLVFLDEEYRVAKWSEALLIGAGYVSSPRLLKALPERTRMKLGVYRESCEAFAKRNYPVYPWPVEAMGCDLGRSSADRYEYFFRQWVPRTAGLLEAFALLFQRRKFAGVLVDEDTVTFRKSLVRVAQRFGVPSFQVPHGVSFSGIQYDLFPVSSARVLVGGDAVKDFYVRNGTAQDKVRVCGVPRMAVYGRTQSPRLRERLARLYGLDVRRPWVLVGATTLFPMEVRRRHSENMRALSDAAAVLGGSRRALQVLLRTHPLDPSPERTREWFCGTASLRCALLDGRTSAPDSIAASDAVLSFPSNLAIEALLALKPTGVLDYFKLARSGIPYLSGEGSWMLAADREGLERLCSRLLEPDERLSVDVGRARDWLRAHWVGAEGRDTLERVMRAIDEGVRNDG